MNQSKPNNWIMMNLLWWGWQNGVVWDIIQRYKNIMHEILQTWRWLFKWYSVIPFTPMTLITDFGVASAANCTINLKFRQHGHDYPELFAYRQRKNQINWCPHLNSIKRFIQLNNTLKRVIMAGNRTYYQDHQAISKEITCLVLQHTPTQKGAYGSEWSQNTPFQSCKAFNTCHFLVLRLPCQTESQLHAQKH